MARTQLSGGLVHTPFLTGLPHLISDKWRQFLATQTAEATTVPAVTTVTVTAATAAIGTTPISTLDPLSAGLYRVTTFLRIVTPASIASSAQPSVVFTDGGVVCTLTGTAVTGNTTASVGTNTFLVRIDAGTPISYAVAYASNAAGMAFDLRIVLEQIG